MGDVGAEIIANMVLGLFEVLYTISLLIPQMCDQNIRSEAFHSTKMKASYQKGFTSSGAEG